MRRLQANFVEDPVAGGWLCWTLLIIGVALAADAGRSVYEAKEALDRAEAKAARSGSRPLSPVSVHKDPQVVEKEIAAAQDVIRKLSVPWGALFAELEKAQADKVRLLAVEPDADTRSLMVSGEGKDLLAVAGYVATLKASPRLSDVYLAHHEIKRNEPNKPVAFSVTAGWSKIR